MITRFLRCSNIIFHAQKRPKTVKSFSFLRPRIKEMVKISQNIIADRSGSYLGPVGSIFRLTSEVFFGEKFQSPSILTNESPPIMSIAFKQWHQVVHDLVVHSAVSQSLLAISSVDFCDHQHLFSDRYCDLCDRDGCNLSLLNSWWILPR